MRFFLLISILFLLFSCGKSYYFEKEFETEQLFDEHVWKKDKAAQFEVDIDDAKAFYNIYVKIVNGEFYPNCNMWLFTKTFAPDGHVQIDTVEIFLADETGKWFGQQQDNLWAGLYPFKMQVAFPQKGKYKFQLVQAMRTDALEEVYKVGLVVNKLGKK